MDSRRRVILALLPLGIPVATVWVWNRERLSHRHGRSLTPAEMEDARAAGVQHPERVRVWLVKRVEVFENAFLNRITSSLQEAFNTTIGITLRYGILIRKEWESDRRLLVHELAHVAQYERLGGIAPFLLQYFRECIREGYFASPLESEATAVAKRICG